MALAVQGDVSDPAAAEAVVAAALAAFGKIDILVNNAGVTRDDLIMRMSIDAWREVLETNLFGAFYTIKAVTRPMLRARPGGSSTSPAYPDRPARPARRTTAPQGRPHRADQGDRPGARSRGITANASRPASC